MRRARTGLLAAPLLAASLFAAACGTVPFRPTEPVATGPTSPSALAGGLWTSGKGTFLIRQSVLFEFGGNRIPMTGILRLDTGEKTARLVGMDSMGIKLFDLGVDRRSATRYHVLPALDRYPGFAGAVGNSVRRIFLDPEPSGDDALRIEPYRYLLSRERDGTSTLFVLGGKERQLMEKYRSGPGERWRVRYYEYTTRGDVPVPGGIVLDDERAGYRLTLWVESVERADE